MSTTIPSIEPRRVTANDLLIWQRVVSDYPTEDGWAYIAALRGPEKLDLTAISDGTFSHAADISAVTTTGYDGRSQTKIILDALDAVIGKRATKGDQSLTVDGTRLDKMQPADLLKWRSVYATKYWRECNPGKLAPTVSIGFVRY